MTIDFSPAYAGRCYDSDFVDHGVAQDCRVIAPTFTEFLELIASTNFHSPNYFIDRSFKDFGPAIVSPQ